MVKISTFVVVAMLSVPSVFAYVPEVSRREVNEDNLYARNPDDKEATSILAREEDIVELEEREPFFGALFAIGRAAAMGARAARAARAARGANRAHNAHNNHRDRKRKRELEEDNLDDMVERELSDELSERDFEDIDERDFEDMDGREFDHEEILGREFDDEVDLD